ncbi:Aldolase-type TIM barrel [Penicillium expansum]|nr:Aldolase-type TIM barrel [Penicillium expansum]
MSRGASIHLILTALGLEKSTDGWTKKQQQQATSIVDQLYDSGVPFFTKEKFQVISRQLKRQPPSGDRIFLDDLFGTKLECVSRLEETEKPGEERKFVYSQFGLAYLGIEGLKYFIKSDTEKPSAFATLQVTLETYQVILDNGARKTIPDGEIRDTETTEKYFREMIQVWEARKSCKKLKSVLSSEASGHKINKIFGTACGSLAMAETDGIAYQHAFLLTDPGNTSVDKEVLPKFDMTVVDDGDAFINVDEQSVWLSIGPDIPVKEVIADIARPAVVIWTLVGSQRNVGTADPDTPRVKDMMGMEYDGYELGEPGHFADAWIYIRKTKDEPPFQRMVKREDDYQAAVSAHKALRLI